MKRTLQMGNSAANIFLRVRHLIFVPNLKHKNNNL